MKTRENEPVRLVPTPRPLFRSCPTSDSASSDSGGPERSATGIPHRISHKLTRKPGPMPRKRKRRSAVVEIGTGPAKVRIIPSTAGMDTTSSHLHGRKEVSGRPAASPASMKRGWSRSRSPSGSSTAAPNHARLLAVTSKFAIPWELGLWVFRHSHGVRDHFGSSNSGASFISCEVSRLRILTFSSNRSLRRSSRGVTEPAARER